MAEIIGVSFDEHGPVVPVDLCPCAVKVLELETKNDKFKVAEINTGKKVVWLYPQGNDFARRCCEVLGNVNNQ